MSGTGSGASRASTPADASAWSSAPTSTCASSSRTGCTSSTSWSTTPRGELHSFQVFDAAGTAVHKIYRRDTTDTDAWEALKASLLDEAPAPITVEPAADPASERPDADIDVDALRTEWAALKDTHDFFPLLRKLDVAREQALRLAGAPFARPVSAREAVSQVLEEAAASEEPIMVFVGNPGCIQIHSGPVKQVKWMGDWLNVLDPEFNLHLDVSQVASGWAVHKPTEDGPVHSLELFAEDGSVIAQFFGLRKPGIPERAWWTDLVARLPALA